MGRRLSQSAVNDVVPLVLPIKLGGTGGTTVDSAHTNLDTASLSKVGTSGNAVPLDGLGKIDPKYLPIGYGRNKPKARLDIIGSVIEINYGAIYSFTLVNHDIEQPVTVTAAHGTVETTDFTYEKNPRMEFVYRAPYDKTIPEEIFYICGYEYHFPLIDGAYEPPPS